MPVVKRIVGVIFLLLAVAFLVAGFQGDNSGGTSQSVLESPEASGEMLGTVVPVLIFGAIGMWLVLGKRLR